MPNFRLNTFLKFEFYLSYIEHIEDKLLFETFKKVDYYVITVAKDTRFATVRNCTFISHCIFSYKVVFFYKRSNMFVLYAHGDTGLNDQRGRSAGNMKINRTRD